MPKTWVIIALMRLDFLSVDAQNMGHNRPHAVGFPIRIRRLDFLSVEFG
jgi:hypothetical protein